MRNLSKDSVIRRTNKARNCQWPETMGFFTPLTAACIEVTIVSRSQALKKKLRVPFMEFVLI